MANILCAVNLYNIILILASSLWRGSYNYPHSLNYLLEFSIYIEKYTLVCVQLDGLSWIVHTFVTSTQSKDRLNITGILKVPLLPPWLPETMFLFLFLYFLETESHNMCIVVDCLFWFLSSIPLSPFYGWSSWDWLFRVTQHHATSNEHNTMPLSVFEKHYF